MVARCLEREIGMVHSLNVVRFPGSPQEPTALAAMPGLAWEPQWKSESRGWRLNVMAEGVFASASVRRLSAGRWLAIVARSTPKGRTRWEADTVADTGSPLDAMRAAELAIAAMAA